MSRTVSTQYLAKKSAMFEHEHRGNAVMELKKALRLLEQNLKDYDAVAERIREATTSLHLALACHQIQDLVENMEEP